MDGVKKRLKDSIQFRLSFWLSAAILGIAALAGAFSFAAAFNEAHELQDDVLRQIAALFDRRHLPVPHLDDRGRLGDSDEESRVIVQYLGAPQAPGVEGDGALALPANLADGIQTLDAEGEPFRVLVKTLASGQRIAVAQETGVRDEIATDSALRTLAPFAVLVPVLLLLVADLVRKMFRPIAELAAEIDRRGESELHPLARDGLPLEIRPFVAAIDRLFIRVAQSMEGQRRFVADAAHELRSPLAALSLQAERLAGAEMPAPAQERLATLRRGIERGRGLLEQLLALARTQSAAAEPSGPASVQAVLRQVLENLMPLAEAKRIDIGVEGDADILMPMADTGLETIVKNLVDNAIRYTPEGGRIDLSAETGDGMAILRICDSGPGIPPAERERVFDPFYRIPGSGEAGSGLGLAIVQAIAGRVGADIHLAFTDEAAKSGLCVEIAVPSATPNSPRPSPR